MLTNLKPMPTTIPATADEQYAAKHTTRLYLKGKPVLSWIKNSTNNNKSEILKPNIILSSDQLNNNSTNNNKINCNQTELKGVQNLKQLWNTRIGAIKDTNLGSVKVLTPAKSYGCLLQKEKPPTEVTRALSTHDCTEIKESTTLPRFTKDNFYKYKTAATAEKNQAKNISPTLTPTLTGRLSFNFPMIGVTLKGEKIHWMRRNDIVVRRKQSLEESPPLAPQEVDNKMNLVLSPRKIETSPVTPQMPCTPSTPCEELLICSDNNGSPSSHPSSETRNTITSHCSSNSLRSTESTTTRKKNANSNRKYSFKTQVKSYHSPRKMPSSTSSNKVATLTQQFNEIIQKDSKLLDEVKRNNGILISRGGHVYKVLDNTGQPMKATSSCAVLSISKSTSSGFKNISTVQRAIKAFESKTNEKPKVPLKSAHVLRKKKELANRNELKFTALDGIPEKAKISIDSRLETVAGKKHTSLPNREPSSDFNRKVEKNDNGTPVKTTLQKSDINIVPISQEEASDDTEKKAISNLHLNAQFANDEYIPRTLEINLQEDSHLNETMRAEIKLILKTMKTQLEKEMHCDSTSAQPKSTIYTRQLSERSSEAKVLKVGSNSQYLTNATGESSLITDNKYQDATEMSTFLEEEDESLKEPSEVKILNAIKEANQKIESLSWKLEDEFGFQYPLNDSFLYQANLRDNKKESLLTEAVNTSLVNYTEAPFIADLKKENALDNKMTHAVNEESIYEVISIDSNNLKSVDTTVQPQKSFLFCNKAGGSCENMNDSPPPKDSDNYESINGLCETKPNCDYGYEICETPEPVPPPRPHKEPSELQRNTTDKLPELPKPKRIIQKRVFSTLTTTDIMSRVSGSDSTAEEENIYDTIKGGHHCYELLQSSKEKNGDTISLTSNGYESINHYRRQPPLCNAESSSTISSDHKTNSLYEVSLVNGVMLTSFHNYSHSYTASSENSDDWVDISDSEVNKYDQIGKQRFIVIRERMKCHRSPDWATRVRDKRLHETISDNDDVDHYYEPLFPIRNKCYVNEIGKTSTPEAQKNIHCGNSNSYLTEDYDSFDTDDDVYEDNESSKKNDSGVDICNIKLPNPPPSKNQVYAFVKKVKNFISNKKSPSDPNKNLADCLQAKMYENTQFPAEDNEYQSTLKPTRRAPDKPKTPKVKSKKLIDKPINKINSNNDNIYENTDFHNPKLKTASQMNSDNVVQLSTSEKNLIAANDIAIRSKSKTGKSFKSRLKSFGTTSFDSKQMFPLTTARSTFYVSETCNEQDSGIFEKTSSGDLVTEKAKVEITDNNKENVTVRKNKKEPKESNPYRRRTTIGIRPNDPPPPPPTLLDDIRKPKQRTSTTSWYAECGVFNIENNVNTDEASLEKHTSSLNKATSSTSWYAEAGLYQTSGVSVASSSGSSGVSTGNEGCAGDDSGHHVFLNEPLYQIYSAEKLESLSRDMEDHESTDGYEEIGGNEQTSDNDRIKRTRPTALQLVGPKSGPSRTLWSEIPEVITSEILLTLTPRERSLQEAKFEIITSEASYLKSLNLLRSHFINNQTFHDTTILSSRDRKTLFSYIAPVHECSEKLLSELENCWQDNIMLLGLSKNIYTCAEKNFNVYVSYCEHQGKMDRALRRLKEAKGTFCYKLDLLESDPVCCGLTLHSFLMLPMQRITRLPLLIDAVFSKVHPNDDEYDSWKLTLAILNKIVAQCNEAANRCEQAHEIERISRQLEFPSHIRALAIAPAGVPATGAKPRFLVKKGDLVHLIWRGDDAKLTFGKKFSKSNIYAFLFSDLLVLTKRKNEEQFTVFDYCPRNMLTISSGDAVPQLPTKDSSQTGKNLILMTLLENHERKTVELVLSCPSVSEMERWLQATRPPEAETPGEKLYEQWDCPQVIAKHEFVANEPDLLGLEVGDVVNVSRKLPDGWFNGERIRDGSVGWFPGSFTEEVNSAHVRARNLKQRYRLLTFTATYLELQKRK